jgi:hypothetical protein
MMLNRRTLVITISYLVTFAVLGCYRLVHELSISDFQHDVDGMEYKEGFNGTWNHTRDSDNMLLDLQQCEQAFPGLFEEVERPVKNRKNPHITLDELDLIPQQNGYVRAMIYNQQVCVQLSTASGATPLLLNLAANIFVRMKFSSALLPQQAAYIAANSLHCTLYTEPSSPHLNISQILSSR